MHAAVITSGIDQERIGDMEQYGPYASCEGIALLIVRIRKLLRIWWSELRKESKKWRRIFLGEWFSHIP